jgi:hypothetical protein
MLSSPQRAAALAGHPGAVHGAPQQAEEGLRGLCSKGVQQPDRSRTGAHAQLYSASQPQPQCLHFMRTEIHCGWYAVAIHLPPSVPGVFAPAPLHHAAPLQAERGSALRGERYQRPLRSTSILRRVLPMRLASCAHAHGCMAAESGALSAEPHSCADTCVRRVHSLAASAKRTGLLAQTSQQLLPPASSYAGGSYTQAPELD